jgi:segregation and condensation protein A
MDPALVSSDERPRPQVTLPAFEGPLDLLLHLVRENQVSIWDIPIALICDQYHKALAQMEELDLEIAGEYLVYAAWLLVIKSRMLLPRREEERGDPRQELVDRLLAYGKVKNRAGELAGIEELRRGMSLITAHAPVQPSDDELTLEEIDVVRLAAALREAFDRHQREHPPVLELEPLRFSVREKIIELFELIQEQRSFPLLSHLLTRPDRLESVTLLVAALELVRLRTASAHQREPFSEIYLTPTGGALFLEELSDG